jgi:very-short-patch-repair endonuclease
MSSKIDLRHLNIKALNLKTLDFTLLKSEYEQVTLELKSKYPQIKNRTISEIVFEDYLIRTTGLKVIHSFWINRYCVDFFIPALSLSIEIDGLIHHQEFKGKKDMSKVEKNRDIGIYTYSIENCDLDHPCVSAFLNNISRLKRKDSRGRKRLLRNIYISTILANRKDSELERNFSPSVREIFSEMRKIL